MEVRFPWIYKVTVFNKKFRRYSVELEKLSFVKDEGKAETFLNLFR